MIHKRLIDKTLELFDFEIANEFVVIRDWQKTDIIRIIVAAHTADSKDVVIKYFNDEFTTCKGLEQQAKLSNYYFESGVKVPKRYKSKKGKYYEHIKINDREVLASIEDKIEGDRVRKINKNIISQLGKYFGKMHSLSQCSNIKFDYGTPWSMFGGNKSNRFGEYDENIEYAIRLKEVLMSRETTINKNLINELYSIYEEKRKSLKEYWDNLPRGPIQGDLSFNNIMIDKEEKITGIIDFNLAGDEVLINHFAGEAAFLSYDGEKIDYEDEKMSDEYLKSFFQNYQKYRKMDENELKVLNDLLRIYRPFKFYRVEKIIELFKEKQYTHINIELESMLEDINKDYFKIIT